MKDLAKALPWVAFWFVFGLFISHEHDQYMAGHETTLYRHKTDEEKRIREAVIQKLEAEAKKENR